MLSSLDGLAIVCLALISGATNLRSTLEIRSETILTASTFQSYEAIGGSIVVYLITMLATFSIAMTGSL